MLIPEEEGSPEKNTRKNNGWKTPKFGKRHRTTDSGTWENPK